MVADRERIMTTEKAQRTTFFAYEEDRLIIEALQAQLSRMHIKATKSDAIRFALTIAMNNNYRKSEESAS